MNKSAFNKAKKGKEQKLVEAIKVAELSKRKGLVFFGTCHCSGRV